MHQEMSVRCIFLVVIYIFVLFSIECRHYGKSKEKINLVLFFAESNRMPISDKGIRFLQMQELAQVKQNAEFGSRQYTRGIYESCEDSLRKNLKYLNHFCKNALGMNTATVRLSNQFIKQGRKYTNSKRENDYQLFENNDLANIDTDTEIKKAKNAQEIVSSPQHSEVFKIRYKRQGKENENDGNNDGNKNGNSFIGDSANQNKKLQQPWDILNVWSQVKFSFFGDLFKDGNKENIAKQINTVFADDINNKRHDPGLFEIVQSTLYSLQENPDPFVLIVFGGKLQEVSDKHSPLVQTLKLIIESTDTQNTLIILTGNCPHIRNVHGGVVEIRENIKESQELLKIPVYAKGPKCGTLAQCNVLYEIPLILKTSLENTSPTFSGDH